jgi:hypothetical protein
MFHYKIVILHAKSFPLQSLVTLTNTLYIYIYIYIAYLAEPSCILKFLFTKYLYVILTTSKNILWKLTIYKASKFMLFTNFLKNFVYLFAKSEFVTSQFPPSFVILFVRTCLCLLNSSHSHSKWSVVCGLILQRHVGSFMILNLWKYDLSLPCPVTIVDKFTHICGLLDIVCVCVFTWFKCICMCVCVYIYIYIHAHLNHVYTQFLLAQHSTSTPVRHALPHRFTARQPPTFGPKQFAIQMMDVSHTGT